VKGGNCSGHHSRYPNSFPWFCFPPPISSAIAHPVSILVFDYHSKFKSGTSCFFSSPTRLYI
jgi:hypothetical protein